MSTFASEGSGEGKVGGVTELDDMDNTRAVERQQGGRIECSEGAVEGRVEGCKEETMDDKKVRSKAVAERVRNEGKQPWG